MEFYNTNITKFVFHIQVSYLSFVIIVNLPVTIIITINNQIFFFRAIKAIKPKTQHSNTSMTSRFTLTNAGRKDDKKRMVDSLRDDESLIGGDGGDMLTTTSTPLTSSPFVSSTPPVTNTNTMPMTSTNTNNMDYFNHSNSNGLNAASMNSMTNNILQNKSSIEIDRNEAYKRLNI
jgi:hypothetical protein